MSDGMSAPQQLPTMMGRSLRLSGRSPDALITALLLAVRGDRGRDHRGDGVPGHDGRHHRPVPVPGRAWSGHPGRARDGQPGPQPGLHRAVARSGVATRRPRCVAFRLPRYGLAVSSPEAANGAMFFLMFFCYASSAFVPIRTMPGWLRGFAEHQPATPITETLRGLLVGSSWPTQLGPALAWCGGLLAGSILLSMVLFRRRTR